MDGMNWGDSEWFWSRVDSLNKKLLNFHSKNLPDSEKNSVSIQDPFKALTNYVFYNTFAYMNKMWICSWIQRYFYANILLIFSWNAKSIYGIIAMTLYTRINLRKFRRYANISGKFVKGVVQNHESSYSHLFSLFLSWFFRLSFIPQNFPNFPDSKKKISNSWFINLHSDKPICIMPKQNKHVI